MPRTVYRISIVVRALCALWMLIANSAFADDPSTFRKDQDRWVPSVGLTLGFTTQRHKGEVRSFQQVFGGFFPFRPTTDDQKYLNNIVIGGSFEVQTPRLLPYKWSPSLFFEGEALNVSSQKRGIAKEGDPKTPLIEPNNISFPDAAILGQGSATSVDTDTAQFGASVGISIPVDLGDWKVSVKPSARYLNQEFNFTGIVSDGDRGGNLPAPPPTIVVLLQGSKSLDVHAIGPGLEIEIAAARVESLAASVFISGGAYRVLSDRDVEFSETAFDNLGLRLRRGNWTAEIDPWIYRASVGMRIKWVGASAGWLGGLFRDNSE